ncbi:hypothetical protein HZ326_11056 [Fusarium oxysporum f. sp. albedinis]|nr:hypothetical protein HZ326_11056 [Fusarium oxysporum f. sp. albedinis]
MLMTQLLLNYSYSMNVPLLTAYIYGQKAQRDYSTPDNQCRPSTPYANLLLRRPEMSVILLYREWPKFDFKALIK